MKRPLILLPISLTIAGCMTASESASSRRGAAILSAADGSARGSAQFSQTPDAVRVNVQVQGLAPGVHGIHVHAVGRCDAPDFSTAGPHWNPTERKHGRDNPDGAHHGDLPNIEVGADGRGALSFDLPSARLDQLFDGDGAALVVHASADDYRTDPSGNSGGRVACGVIARR